MLADYTNIELFSDHQTRDIIAQLILGSLVVIFTLSVIGGFLSKTAKPLQLSNNFDLGYITDDEVIEQPQEVQIVVEEKDELKELKRQVEIAKLKKQLAELQKPAFDNNLMKDCVDALTLSTLSSISLISVSDFFNFGSCSCWTRIVLVLPAISRYDAAARFADCSNCLAISS